MSMPRTQQDFNDYIAGEMREADKRMDKLVEDMAELKAAQSKTSAMLAENVQAVASIKADTADMLATFESWRGAMRTLEMIGKLAKPVSYIVGLLASIAAFYTAMKSGIGTK